MEAIAPQQLAEMQPNSPAGFDYALPAELIAQLPLARRDGGRLMILDRDSGVLRHSQVDRLSGWLRRGDVLVLNDSRVVPARLAGHSPTGGAVELLLVADLGGGRWSCLGKPAKRLRVGERVAFASGESAEVLQADAGRYRVRFSDPSAVRALLEREGEVPLPPYIKRPGGPLPIDRERYQTVYANQDGAIAAPTAGLHFTEGLLQELRHQGILTVWLTLHVGPATFAPLRGDALADGRLEAEKAQVSDATVQAIQAAKREGRRVIAVGTTTTRALESAACRPSGLTPGVFSADAFIQPGFRFRIVDGLMTNFHLPRSTLLMLVSAFAGRRAILDAYSVAVAEQYRFYSYGDAMLVS